MTKCRLGHKLRYGYCWLSIPKHPVTLDLDSQAWSLDCPSANLSGKVSGTFSDCDGFSRASLEQKMMLTLTGQISNPILDLSGERPCVFLRQGSDYHEDIPAQVNGIKFNLRTWVLFSQKKGDTL